MELTNIIRELELDLKTKQAVRSASQHQDAYREKNGYATAFEASVPGGEKIDGRILVLHPYEAQEDIRYLNDLVVIEKEPFSWKEKDFSKENEVKYVILGRAENSDYGASGKLKIRPLSDKERIKTKGLYTANPDHAGTVLAAFENLISEIFHGYKERGVAGMYDLSRQILVQKQG